MASEYDNLLDGKREKRRLPQFAIDCNESDSVWSTSQVFVGKKSHERSYMAAEKEAGGCWNLCLYTYSLRSESESDISRKRVDYFSAFVDCAEAIAEFEKQQKELRNKPVEHLKGNYRDVVCKHGAYFNDKGELVYNRLANGAIKENLSVKRSGAAALFNKFAGDANDINSWDDFYTKIVNAFPVDGDKLNEIYGRSPDLPKLQEVVSSALTLMGIMDGQITDVDAKQLKKAKEVFADNTAIYRLADMGDDGEDADGGTPRIVYDYEVARLVTLLRFASKTAQTAFSGFDIDTESLDMLEKTRATIVDLATEKLGINKKVAQQIAALPGKGADPYVGTPLPFAAYLKVTPPSQKPTPPSPPSP